MTGRNSIPLSALNLKDLGEVVGEAVVHHVGNELRKRDRKRAADDDVLLDVLANLADRVAAAEARLAEIEGRK